MTERNGVDVSSYQGPPGQWRAEAGDIGWAAVKISELSAAGGYVNPYAAPDWAWLKAQKLGRLAYLYGHPAVSVQATVAYFLAELSRAGLAGSDAVGVDLEVTDGRTPAEVSLWIREVLASLRRHLGRKPVLYTFIDFATDGNCDGCGGYPLWISDPSSPAGHPRVPGPWKGWAIHQFATGGPIDDDLIAYPDVAAMQAALGKTPVPRERRKDDPMQIPAGNGTETAIGIPGGTGNLHLVTGADASDIEIEFHGHPAEHVTLTWAHGSTYVPVPDRVRAVKITRTDSSPAIDLTFEA